VNRDEYQTTTIGNIPSFGGASIEQ